MAKKTEVTIALLLDEMPDLKEEDILICKEGSEEEGFTVDRIYHVGPNRTLMSDFGMVVSNCFAKFVLA